MTAYSKEILENAISFIQTIEALTPEERARFIEMINKSEDPREVLDKIEDNLQNQISNDFKEAGVEIDQNDPEYKAAYKEMTDEIGAAEKEFTEEMSGIEKEAENIKRDATQEADDIKLQAIRSGLAEK